MEKKSVSVGIITRHFISNYGSFLQSFATVKQLEKMGYHAEIIDYIPEIETIKNDAKFCIASKNVHGFKKILYHAVISPLHRSTAKKFQREREAALPCSKKYSERNIKDAKYDIYLSGSDQIWGPIGLNDYDLNYFLAFTDSPNKLGYSCSFGHTNFSAKYKSVFIEQLKKYRMIGVREQSAVDYLNTLGIPSTLVMDPTFFLSKEEYLKFAKKKIDCSGYILIYQLHYDSPCHSFAKEISEQLHLPIIEISPNKARYKPFNGFHYTADPFEFLQYMNNAKYIITDSFHATVFSLILQKQFLSVNPGGTSTRITSLLNIAGIPERYSEFPEVEAIVTPIDYSKVSQRLNEKISESKFFLAKELDACSL